MAQAAESDDLVGEHPHRPLGHRQEAWTNRAPSRHGDVEHVQRPDAQAQLEQRCVTGQARARTGEQDRSPGLLPRCDRSGVRDDDAAGQRLPAVDVEPPLPLVLAEPAVQRLLPGEDAVLLLDQVVPVTGGVVRDEQVGGHAPTLADPCDRRGGRTVACGRPSGDHVRIHSTRVLWMRTSLEPRPLHRATRARTVCGRWRYVVDCAGLHGSSWERA